MLLSFDYETGIYAESAGRGEGGLVRRFVVLFGSFFVKEERISEEELKEMLEMVERQGDEPRRA